MADALAWNPKPTVGAWDLELFWNLGAWNLELQ